MSELLQEDLLLAVRRLPPQVRELLKAHRLVVAGGWVRSAVAGEPASDIDLFGADAEALQAAETALVAAVEGDDFAPRRYESGLSVTISWRRPPVQFIRAWTFDDAAAVIAAFDWTVARAAIWYDAGWKSVVDPRFYQDLAARRLVYRRPERGAETGGREVGASVLRMLKFVRRGYRIRVPDVASLLSDFNFRTGSDSEAMLRALRLADPLPPDLRDNEADFEEVLDDDSGGGE